MEEVEVVEEVVRLEEEGGGVTMELERVEGGGEAEGGRVEVEVEAEVEKEVS